MYPTGILTPLFFFLAQNLKKRWCVLHDGTLMWFKGKQDFIKAGWLTKMGGGTSTLGRKNWKRRWFTLKGGELHYHPSEDDDAEVLGIIDVQHCDEVSNSGEEDLSVKKENAFAIKTSKRTYFCYADTPEEANEWVAVLRAVKGRPDEELRSMMVSARVDQRNAQGTIEMEDILSVGPANRTDVDGHPVFVVLCADRVEKFVAADQDDLDDWVRVLSPKKGGKAIGGANDEGASERGWMLKMGGKANSFKRRRWFVLRESAIPYFKTPSDDYSVGSIILNSLCSVIPPDETSATTRNDWTFIIHTKRKSYHLTCKTQADCNRWINAVQDVIDNSPVVETDTETLIDQLKMASPQEVETIYSSKDVLNYSGQPLRNPLLPLPYGETTTASSGRSYDTLQEEAVKVSNSLLAIDPTRPPLPRHGTPAEPIPLIKKIVQACFDVQKLRNEVYCQVIKLTSNAPDPGSPLNMTHWHLLGALCCSFLPSRKFVRFLRFHLRRTSDMGDIVGQEVVGAATFCLEALRHTKTRDFPPSTEEIKGIMSGRGLACVVHCVGGRDISLPITSSTTCGEVIQAVKKELQLSQCRNGFGLFENCGSVDKYLEEKVRYGE